MCIASNGVRNKITGQVNETLCSRRAIELFLELAPNGQNRNWVTRKHAHIKRLPKNVSRTIKNNKKQRQREPFQKLKTNEFENSWKKYIFVMCFVSFHFVLIVFFPVALRWYFATVAASKMKFKLNSNSEIFQIHCGNRSHTFAINWILWKNPSRGIYSLLTTTARQAFDHFTLFSFEMETEIKVNGRHICAHAKA